MGFPVGETEFTEGEEMIGLLLNLFTTLTAVGSCALNLFAAAVTWHNGRQDMAVVFMGLFFLNLAALLAFGTLTAISFLEYVHRKE
jgi:hypothetical protein